MRKKAIFFMIVALLMLSALLVACSGGTTTPTTTSPPTTSTPTATTPTTSTPTSTATTPTSPTSATPTETVAPPVSADKPQYGGRLKFITPTNIDIFMPGVQNRGVQQDGFVLEQILGIDHAKGPAGTGETDYGQGVSDFKYVLGNLATDWSTPEIGVWVLDIRQGVHFALNPDSEASRLVNGREMTAEDVAYSIEWMRDTPSSWIQFAEPTLIKNTTVNITGPWQITVHTPVAPTTTYLWLMGGGGNQYVFPKEDLDKYGTVNDWRDAVGTGPYILKDFVSDSAATYDRNPNYWRINDAGPGKGDQLPYPDGIDYLIVPDLSTRLAAMRTGTADFIFNDRTSREDYQQLIKTNPQLQSYKTIIDPLQVGMRTDLPNQPFHDKRVRQAMMLAIDQPSMVKDLFGGEAELLDSPARKIYPSIYTPLDQLSPEIQELYQYHPDKAKQLLAEAGYPNGFSANMIIQNTPESTTAAEAMKAMWDQVGIHITLEVQEAGAFTATWAGHKTEDMILTRNAGGTGALFVRYSMGYFRGPNIFNISHVDDPPGTDPTIENAYNVQAANVNINYPAADKAYKDVIPYILDNAFLIPMPAAHGYIIWQPWMKNYYGEFSAKFFLPWVWLDQNLKKSMGH